MSLNRRHFLAGTALGGAYAMTPDAALAEDGARVTVEPAPAVDDRLDGPLINTAQAQKVMAEHDLAGLIALNPVNVYYLTNTVPIGVVMRWEYPSFATLPRDPDEPTFLVTTTAQLMDIVRGDRWVPDVIPYSAPANLDDYKGENALDASVEPVAASRSYAVREGAELNETESKWVDAQRNYQPAATPEWGVVRALRESGVTSGRIAVDDWRIVKLLEKIGMADRYEFVDGDSVFRRIRIIKSANEIELMRLTAVKNHAAAKAMIGSIEAGMTFADIERRFATECAARGNDLTFILAGVSLGLLPHGEIVPGEPFLVDAVSHYRQYHGDFARTVVVGEPDKAVTDRAKAQQAAREATLALAKPGSRYSDIRAAGFEAWRKAGQDPRTLIVNPHSVGLQHTDQPSGSDALFRIREDIVLEAGMTLTIDLPYIEIGFGAGHNEDLILITDDGYEPLHEEDGPLLIV